MRHVLGLAAVAALAFATAAPPAHAGCVDDYLYGPKYPVPRQETVTVSGGVVSVDTNAVVPDATEAAGFAVFVTTNQAGRLVVLVDCIK